MTCGRSVVFSGFSAFFNQSNWNIVESGVKHHAPFSQKVVNCTISDLSYDHLPSKFGTVSQNLSESFFLRVPIYDLWSSLCGVAKIDQFIQAAHLSLNSYICSNKILNIFIFLVYVDTNHMYKYFGKCILFLIKPLPNFASNHLTVFNARGLYWNSIHQTKFSIILKW
jgi:hypothetical protein